MCLLAFSERCAFNILLYINFTAASLPPYLLLPLSLSLSLSLPPPSLLLLLCVVKVSYGNSEYECVTGQGGRSCGIKGLE